MTADSRGLFIRCKEAFLAFLPMGFISFGGPQGFMALLLKLFVIERKWVTENVYMELYAVANSQPGPSAAMLTYSIVLVKHGALPAVLATLITILPGAIAMGILGYGVSQFGQDSTSLPTWLLYLERSLAAVSIGLVIVACKLLASKILVDHTTITLATLAIILVLNFSAIPWLILLVTVFGGLVTWIEAEFPVWKEKIRRMRKQETTPLEAVQAENPSEEPDENDDMLQATNAVLETSEEPVEYYCYGIKAGIGLLVLTLAIFITSAIIHGYSGIPRFVTIFTTFYFYGSILYGGVIPILYTYLVTGYGWLSPTEFLIGFSVMSILPGFGYNFASYAGALAFRGSAWTSFVGALLADVAFFGPGMLMNAGLVPFWKRYRELPLLKKVFKGLTSVSVGLMIGSVFLLINKAISLPGNRVVALGEYPGWTALMIVSFVAMDTWKVQPWWAVVGGTILGILVWVLDGRP